MANAWEWFILTSADVGVGQLGWEGWVSGWVAGSEAVAVGLGGMPRGRQWQRHSHVVLGVVGSLLLSWLVFVLIRVLLFCCRDGFNCCVRSMVVAACSDDWFSCRNEQESPKRKCTHFLSKCMVCLMDNPILI